MSALWDGDEWIDRFWSYVDRSGGPDACWLWTGCKCRGGYGQFNVPRLETNRSNRVALAIKLGRKLMRSEQALHTCPEGDNPLCCNPRHLSIGTDADNGRHRRERLQSARGSRQGSAMFTEETAIFAMARLLSGESRASVARSFGVDWTTADKLWKGENWSWLFN